MTEDYYKKALEAARAELADLTHQKDEIDKRIAHLRQTVVSLAALSEDEDGGEVYVPSAFQRQVLSSQKMAAEALIAMAGKKIGFSDVCRDVLKTANDYMTPVEIRDALIRMGINLDAKYTNPLAVIHRTLKRLEESKAIDTTTIDGKTNYRWKSSLPIYSKKLVAEAEKQRVIDAALEESGQATTDAPNSMSRLVKAATKRRDNPNSMSKIVEQAREQSKK